MNVDEVIEKALADREFREALAERMKKTLLGWEEGNHRFERWNLSGNRIASGARHGRDMSEADKSLVEQGFTLTNAE